MAPAVANVENFSSTRFPPHWGHSGGSGLRVNTSFSKTCPQLQQAYSKIGMANQAHFLGLMSQLSCLEFPAGEAPRRAQVKREIPGMRGRTRNQTTRKRTKIKKLSIVKLYAPCSTSGKTGPPHAAPSADGLVKAPEAGHPLPLWGEGDLNFLFPVPSSLFPIPRSLFPTPPPPA